MKYECVKCRKTYEESEIVMAESNTLAGTRLEPYCNECYKQKGEKKVW